MNPVSRATSATLDVLEALMGPDDELYGYQIARNAGRKTGVVYPILDRLSEAGWVESWWEDVPDGRGPRRRFYQLTPDGLTAARALLMERRGAVLQRTAERARYGPGKPVITFRALLWGRR